MGGISCTRTGDDVMYIVPSCGSAMTSASKHAASAQPSINVVRSKCELISLYEYLVGVRDMYV